MNSAVKKGLYCALFVGGLSLLGIGAANAAETSGDDGTASGTQAIASLLAPVAVHDTAISVIGDSSSGGTSPGTAGPSGTQAPDGTATTSGEDGTASGSQAILGLTAPVDVGGNAISVLGDSRTAGTGETEPAAGGPSDDPAAPGPATSGTEGVASGTQVAPTAIAPVELSGNAVSVLGDSSAGSTATPPAPPTADDQPGEETASGDGTLPGESSIAGLAGERLAYTGANPGPLLGPALLLSLAGIAALTVLRRRNGRRA